MCNNKQVDLQYLVFKETKKCYDGRVMSKDDNDDQRIR